MEQNEWQVVCEKCGWEGLAKELVSSNLEDNCPQCHSNKIEWKGEQEDDFAALYKELAILEKQSGERYQKIIADLEAAIQYGRDSINEMAKQISRQNDLIVSLEAQIDQDELTKNDLRNNLMDFKEECNRLEGVVRHWQMKYYENGREGAVPPKIDHL